MANNIRCEITKEIAVLSCNDRGFTKEINMVSWNGAEPKYDIRNWHPDHESWGKGITLTKDEILKLMEALEHEAIDDTIEA